MIPGIVLIVSLVYVALFYLLVRFELIAFELVITRSKTIAPLWRSAGPRTLPWLGLTVLIGTLSTLLMVPFGVAAGRTLFTGMQPFLASHNPDDPIAMLGMFRFIFGFYGVLAIIFLVPKFVSVLFNDFVLPFYMLEPISLWQACARGFRLLGANFGSSLGYLVCKFFLFFAGLLAQNLVTQVVTLPFLLLFFLFAIVAGFTHGSLADRGLLLGAAALLLVLVFLIAIFYVAIGATGYLMTVLESYTAYFVGSRYPALGDLLQPPPPPVYTFTPPPPPPSVEEQDEDDDGPSLPMNPAVA